MTKAITKRRPTHRVYVVTKTRNGENGHWAEIGALWPHQDGKGFGVTLAVLPLSRSAEIVIREARERSAG